MDLWVRSQDKRILQKVNNIFLDANYENKRVSTYDGDNVELGTYETKERALEVLDEIQEKIKAGFVYDSRTSYNMNQTIFRNEIYQMPKE